MAEHAFFNKNYSNYGRRLFQTSGFTMKNSYFTKMLGFWLNIGRNDWCYILTINLATFGDIWNFLESGNWKSGNLEIPGNWLVLANFNILGIFPTQFRSLSLIFNSEFQIFSFSGIWKLEIWKSGNSRKLASFGQFQYIGHFSHSV